MKLRLRENTIRIRLLRSEIAQLEETGSLTETIKFGADQKLVYMVAIDDNVAEVSAAVENAIISISIPKKAAESWINSEDVGLTNDQKVDQQTVLNILIEKDFVCLSRPMEGDNLDAFPNPEAEKC
ncbi:MAG: hypothetical protein R2681_03725 [Pyrinomonadaceae bacterium]